MAWSVTASPDRFDEAADWFKSRIPYTREQYDKIDDQARKRAFWISGGLELDAVQTVFSEVDRAIEHGTPIDEFKKRVKEKLGKLSPDGAHLETVLRNWTQTAYSTGRWYQIQDPDLVLLRPFIMYDAVLDSRTCFAAGTRVSMADGSYRSIEHVSPGDRVLSCRGRARTVEAALVTPKRAWGSLRLSNGTVLRVTPNHPILTAHGWIRAKLLDVGDELVLGNQELSRLWSSFPDGAEERVVLLGRLPSVRQEAARLPPVRSELPSERQGRTQGLLQRGVQGRTRAPEGLRGEAGELQKVQRGLLEDDQDAKVLQLGLLSVQQEDTSMPRVRQGVQASGESWSAGILHSRVQGSVQEAGQDVSWMREAIPGEQSQQDLLLQGLQPNGGDVPVVLEGVRVPQDLCSARAVPVLLGCMQAHGEAQGLAAASHAPDVSAVRLCISSRSEAREGGTLLLLDCLPQAAASEVHPVREVGHETRQYQILFGELLPKAYGRDGARAACARSASGGANPVRAGGTDRQVVDRLLGGQPDLLGGGRGLLAPQSSHESQGRPARQGADEARLCCNSTGREEAEGGPTTRDPRALAIWPIPGAGLASAKTTAVVAVHWELTETSESAYDLQVEDDAGFIADGVVVHNSDICRNLDGTIKRHDDEFWLTHCCPMHHRCRSSLRSLRTKEALERGVTQGIPEGTDAQDGFGKAPPLRGDDDNLEPKQSRFDPEVWEEFKKRQTVMLGELSEANAAAETARIIRDRQDPNHWLEADRKLYGDAAPAVSWGRAMEHRGLEMSPKDALAEHRKLVRAGAKSAPEFEASIRKVLDAQGVSDRDIDSALSTKTLRELVLHADAEDMFIESANIRGASALVGHSTSIERSKGAAEFDEIIATTWGTQTQVQLEEAAAKMTRFFDAFADASVKHPAGVLLQPFRGVDMRSRGGYTTGQIDPGPGQLRNLVHEWAHGLDDVNPDLAARALAFRTARTRGEPLKPMDKMLKSTAFVGESGLEDQFYTPYMGKVYDGGMSDITEVTTMAIEAIVREPVGRMVAIDPATLYFALGQLAGSKLP